jgi:peptidoglycan/LPS O-acetylase OafA/YrhL
MKSATAPSSPAEQLLRYPILDALRFVLAFWVAVAHHGMFPLFGGMDEATRAGRFLPHAWSTVVYGTPAVIVFFVISGFCIHLPFSGTRRLAIGRFYLRRYTRILIPVAGALALYRVFGQRLHFFGEGSILWASPLWSLLCEEIYYAAYPLLRFFRNRFGWTPLLAGSFLGSAVINALQPHAVRWHNFGPVGTAAILLPIWLLGALLAEQAASVPVLSSSARIWMWRFAAWLGCWASEMLHFKLGIHAPVTMVPFGVLAYFWVRNEIAYVRHQAPNSWLVAAGAWSYSLYLMHGQGMDLYSRLRIPYLGFNLDWIFTMGSALLFAWLFYLLVERPSHRFARRIRLSAPVPSVSSASSQPAEAAP